MLKLFRILRGRWRQLFGFCPACNSDAPELDTCLVCLSYTRFPPNARIKARRWERFMAQECP